MNLRYFAKYIDQPSVINKIQRTFPVALVGVAGVSDVALSLNSPKEKRKENTIRNSIILGSVVVASLIGARGLKLGKKQILKGLMPVQSAKSVATTQKTAIENYVKSEQNLSNEIKTLFDKTKGKAFKPKEIEKLFQELPDNENRKKLFDVLFEPVGKLTSKGIFEDMKRLPQYGAYAIGSGLAGGIIADKITKNESKKNTANKVKEAIYQYFANTFLCITGAGVALAGLERLEKKGVVKNVTSTKKIATVIGGIVGVGVVFGSIFANAIGKKIINPLFNQQETAENKKKIYSERHPEMLDLCIHVDDLATAGVYSGFRWVESIMPIFYLLSGYRAGVGHRNAKVQNNKSEKSILQQTPFMQTNILTNYNRFRFSESKN